jgi:CheY-like chemotaxis protein
MDGFEATAAIRKLPEPAGSIPIVAMTAHAGSKDRQRCLESGMDDHVAKPVDRRVLSAVLQRLLGPATGGAAVGASEPAASAVAALVDGAVLDQLRSDAGPSLVSELLAAFMAETEERVLRMPPALKAGDLDSVAADAHAMKSSCGTFGAVRLQKLVERIESAAARNDVGLASELLDGLPDLVAQSWGEFARAGYPPLSS